MTSPRSDERQVRLEEVDDRIQDQPLASGENSASFVSSDKVTPNRIATESRTGMKTCGPAAKASRSMMHKNGQFAERREGDVAERIQQYDILVHGISKLSDTGLLTPQHCSRNSTGSNSNDATSTSGELSGAACKKGMIVNTEPTTDMVGSSGTPKADEATRDRWQIVETTDAERIKYTYNARDGPVKPIAEQSASTLVLKRPRGLAPRKVLHPKQKQRQ